jgi:histidine ammonia-lyase
MHTPLLLKPGQLTLDQLRVIYQKQCAIELDPAARETVEASTHTVNQIIANERTVYASTPVSACWPEPRSRPSR